MVATEILNMYKICFYVPVSYLEIVKNKLFAQGAGKIGNYQCCAWQVLGESQYMPLAGSNPFIGEQDRLNKEPEYKVELVCAEEFLHPVINALKQSHPYEEPAYQVLRLENI